MGIERVKIKNYKSLKNIDISIDDGGVSCLLGKNGAGKSSIMQAIKYLYRVAYNPIAVETILDKKNRFIQKTSIEICFNVSYLYSIEHIYNEFLEYEDYLVDHVHLPIRLTQYKNGRIEWYPFNDIYKIRKILSYFPVYFVEVKKISSNSWNDIWTLVSDIAISACDDDENNHAHLVEVFKEIYGDKFDKTYSKINKVLSEEKIEVNQSDYRVRYKNAILSSLGGENFLYNEESMDYYSHGINSLKYLSLYIKLLIELSVVTPKNICILIDEPEISLHQQFIDELSGALTSARKLQFIIATHSPHLLTNLINDDKSILFYKIFERNGYSYISKYSIDNNKKKECLISDNETASFFSNGIMFVEGMSEAQLFSNRNLNNIFPEFKSIMVYCTDSNDKKVGYIYPKRGDRSIPYLNVLDMDQIITYVPSRNKFKIVWKKKNPLGNREIERKEKYYYGSKRSKAFKTRKTIERLLNNTHNIDRSNFDIGDSSYEILIDNIRKYCFQYNVYPVKTTVEGILICRDSYVSFLDWLRTTDYLKIGQNGWNAFSNTLNSYSIEKQINILRSIFLGKLDSLKNYYEKNPSTNQIYVDSNTKRFIERYKIQEKTNGWMNEYIDWVITIYLTGNIEEKKNGFFQLFPEFKYIDIYVNYMISLSNE